MSISPKGVRARTQQVLAGWQHLALDFPFDLTFELQSTDDLSI